MSRELDKIDQELKKRIALRFKELRKESGKNQTEFAYDYNKDKQSQNRLEGGRGATIYSINKFCKALGITLSHFFDSPLFQKKKATTGPNQEPPANM
jgi:transcriptional regulator with XRE-family HTH domain